MFAYAGLAPETHDCIVRDIRQWPTLGHFRMSADALIDRSRNRAASMFLAADPAEAGDVMVMIDHDMTWAPGDLEHLTNACLETGGVVAGIYSKRSFGKGVAVRFSQPGDWQQGSDQLAPCDYVSTGFMAIHRKVLETLAEKLPKTLGDFYPFFLPVLAERKFGDQEATEYLSEDWAFCYRAIEAGFTIHADMKPYLVHCGEYGYRVIDSQVPPVPDQLVNFQVQEDLKTPVFYFLLRDLANFTRIAPDTINEAIMEGRQQLAALWHAVGGFDKEEEWYKREDVGKFYVLDLAGWHFSNLAHKIEAEFEGISGKRCLDYGAGIGTLGLSLAVRGNEVDYLEPNDEMVRFLNHRLDTDELQEAAPRMKRVAAPDGLYDLIICNHVLEHVPDPVATAAELVSHLAPGGAIFTDSDFHKDDGHPMHHDDHEQRGEDCWRAAGLEPLGDTTLWWGRSAILNTEGEKGQPGEEKELAPLGAHS